MNLFHDRREDRLILRQPEQRLGAAILFIMAIGCFVGPVFVLRENADAVAWLLAALLVLVGIYCLWNGIKAITEVVATFDGGTRMLTIRRTRPWRAASQSVAFDDVFDVATQARTRWTGHTGIPFPETYYGIEIALAGERKVWMHESAESECDSMARQVLAMIRRPARATASPST